MTIHLNPKDAGRLGIEVSPALRDLRTRQEKLVTDARAKIGEITDKTDDKRAKEIEAEYDRLMAEYDRLEERANREAQLSVREATLNEADPRRPMGRNLRVGRSSEDEEINFALRPEQRMTDWLFDRNKAESTLRDLSVGQYFRAMFTGAKTDTEQRALSEGTNSAGGFTVPDVLSATMIDNMRANMVTMQAGARTVPLTSDTNYIAKVLTDPVPAWRSEAGNVAESDPTFTRVTFTPRSLSVLVKVSRELLQDSLNINTVLPAIISASMAREVDRVCLNGSGTPPEPTGITNFSGVLSVAHSAALTNYTPFISARTKIKSENAPGVSAYIMSPHDEGTLAALQATDNQPMMIPPAIANVPFLATTAAPGHLGVTESPAGDTSIITGWFPYLLVGFRHNIEIQVLRERYADTGQFAFVAHLRMDVAAEHENAFCKITGITH